MKFSKEEITENNLAKKVLLKSFLSVLDLKCIPKENFTKLVSYYC